MDIPPELKGYLRVMKDQWDVVHIECLKCHKKFFTLRDAALHISSAHGVKMAQKYGEIT